MRRLIYSMSISLDGYAETRDRSLDWVIVDEELHTEFNRQAREVDAFLYGRRTYELMAGYWPDADADPANLPVEIEFSRIWKAMPKIVFSKSLEKVDWNSRLFRGDAVEEIARLKSEPGGDLGVAGPELAGSLIQRGLVDEFRLFVNPIILGDGRPCFPSLEAPLQLKLVETHPYSAGVTYLRFSR